MSDTARGNEVNHHAVGVSPDGSVLAHAPPAVPMVGYTMLSLWIVSRPVVSA